MTVAVNDRQTAFVGNGIVTVFPFDFPMTPQGNVEVFVGGVLFSPLLYTLDKIARTVTFITPPAAGLTIIVKGATPLTQLITSSRAGSTVNFSAIEEQLDNMVNAQQELTAAFDLLENFSQFDDRYLGEKLVLPTTDNNGLPLVGGTLVSLANQTPETLNGMYVYQNGAWRSILNPLQGLFTIFRYVATGGQTVFTGADANGATLGYMPNTVLVAVNGATQAPNTYTATNGTSVVLGTPLNASDVVVVYSFGSFAVANTWTKDEADNRYISQPTRQRASIGNNQANPDVVFGTGEGEGFSYFTGIDAIGLIKEGVARLFVYDAFLNYAPDGTNVRFAQTNDVTQTGPDHIVRGKFALGGGVLPNITFKAPGSPDQPLLNVGFSTTAPYGTILETGIAGGVGMPFTIRTAEGISTIDRFGLTATPNGVLGSAWFMNANVGVGKTAPNAPFVIARNRADSVDAPYLTFENLASGYGAWGFAKSSSNDLSLNCATGTDVPATAKVMVWKFGVAGAAQIGVNASPNASFDVAGTFARRIVPLTLVNGMNSNIVLPLGSVLRVSGPTTAFSVGGVTGGVNGMELLIINPVGQAMTIVHEDASSTAGNRIRTATGANVVLAAGASYRMIYDATASRWQPGA